MGGDKMKLNPKYKILLIFSLFLVFFIILCVVYYFNTDNKYDKKSSTDKSLTNNYKDPGSGETISNPIGKAKEKTTSSQTIAYLGFSDLLSHGITYKQFLKLKAHFKEYSDAKKLNIKEISITTSTYKSEIDKKTGEVIMSFEVTIDRKNKLNAKVAYFGLNMPILYLYDMKTNLIFKSYTGGN